MAYELKGWDPAARGNRSQTNTGMDIGEGWTGRNKLALGFVPYMPMPTEQTDANVDSVVTGNGAIYGAGEGAVNTTTDWGSLFFGSAAGGAVGAGAAQGQPASSSSSVDWGGVANAVTGIVNKFTGKAPAPTPQPTSNTNWLPMVLLGGGAIVAIVLLSKKRKKAQ